MQQPFTPAIATSWSIRLYLTRRDGKELRRRGMRGSVIAYYGPHSIGHYYPCKKYKSERKEQVCELVTSPPRREFR